MKIMFYISSLDHGGAERVISNLANYFSNNKKNNVYLVIERPTIRYKISKNVNVICMEKYEKKYNFIYKKIRYIFYTYKLKKLTKKIKPDVIIPFLVMPAIVSLIIKSNNVKVIVGVRNDPKKEYDTRMKYFLMTKLFPKADGFVFQTEDAKNYFNDIINCQQEIIYNPVSEKFINHNVPKIRRKAIVSVGRLEKQKNYSLLIKAFSIISKKYDDYILEIYGKGSEKDKIDELIKKLHLEDKVVLCGNSKQIEEKIFDASSFVMTSIFEGMPNALIEAMVLGLPVISTDCPCGGPRELITNNVNGVLINVNDLDALVNAMDRIINDIDFSSQLSNEARKIIRVVDPNIIYGKWDEFIKKILKK